MANSDSEAGCGCGVEVPPQVEFDAGSGGRVIWARDDAEVDRPGAGLVTGAGTTSEGWVARAGFFGRAA